MPAREKRADETAQALLRAEAVSREVVDRCEVIGIRAVSEAEHEDGECDNADGHRRAVGDHGASLSSATACPRVWTWPGENANPAIAASTNNATRPAGARRDEAAALWPSITAPIVAMIAAETSGPN